MPDTKCFEYVQNQDLYIQKFIIVENSCIGNNFFWKIINIQDRLQIIFCRFQYWFKHFFIFFFSKFAAVWGLNNNFFL